MTENDSSDLTHTLVNVAKKRTIADLWSCSCCLGTLEDDCVPAVMNCRPFAHAICVTCADKLLERSSAKCPKCNTEFTHVRPLAEFVDTNNEGVASTLAKKAKKNGTTFEENLAAVLATIDNNVINQRVKFFAERTKGTIEHMEARGWSRASKGSAFVPLFDKSYVSIRVSSKNTSRDKLQEDMKRLTKQVIDYVQPLFPKVKLEPHSDKGKPCRYLWVRIKQK